MRRRCFGEAACDNETPLEFTRGEGVYLFDTEGRRYLDMCNNALAVGHGHPEVVSAIAAQAATLNTHACHLNKAVEAYAARLLAQFPAPLGSLAMTSSGSESNDLALRIARAVTGRLGVIVTQAASHGSTAAVAEISALRARGRELPPYVRTIPAPDPALAGGAPLGAWFAAQVREAAAALRDSGAGFAALVLDSTFASDGVFTDPPGFLAEAVEAAREAGGLFVADEVQAGFGRTGEPWGFLRHGVVPDIVTLGEPMGNGYPMGGVVTCPDYLAVINDAAPFSSSPVAAAAGIAVLDVIEGEGLIRNAGRSGEILRKGLKKLEKSFPLIRAVRGAGLYIGVDLAAPAGGAPDPEAARRVADALRRNLVLIGHGGLHGHTLHIRPPLSFTAEHAAHFLESLHKVLAALG